MTRLERRGAEHRAYQAAGVVAGMMCDFLGEESPLHDGGETLDDSFDCMMELICFDLHKYETAAETSEAFRKAAKLVKSEIDSGQAEAWLNLCVDLVCKSLSSAQRGDEATALSTANECIGTCMEALQVLDVFNDKAVESLFTT